MLRNIVLCITLLVCITGCSHINTKENTKGTMSGFVVQKDLDSNSSLIVSDTKTSSKNNNKIYEAAWISGIGDKTNIGEKVTIETTAFSLMSYPKQTSGEFLSKEKFEKPEGAILEPEEVLKKVFEQKNDKVPSVEKISFDKEKKIWNITIYDNIKFTTTEITIEDQRS
ncbi:hypothetical protein [Paenibacillus chitinolyticus]|uniref:hypothetical protein n=1 Tax=Paenibacillus chitinolyticus TaxID=79263 RepID=UPI00366523B9